MCISRTVVLIETEDARDADALHRNLLDLLDVLLPLLGGWRASVRSVEDRANLIARKDRIGLVFVDIEHTVLVVGTKEVGHQFHHLTYLFLQGEFLQGLFYLSLYLRVALDNWNIGTGCISKCQHRNR